MVNRRVRYCLATENAPEGKRTRYGMFTQLGAPIGFILATRSFLTLGHFMTEEAFMTLEMAYSLYFECFTGNCRPMNQFTTS